MPRLIYSHSLMRGEQNEGKKTGKEQKFSEPSPKVTLMIMSDISGQQSSEYDLIHEKTFMGIKVSVNVEVATLKKKSHNKAQDKLDDLFKSVKV